VPGVGKRAGDADGLMVGIALQSWNGSGEGRVLVLINLSQARLDPAVAGGSLTTGGAYWELDGESGRIKALGAIDLNNHELTNVKAITSASGNWQIDEHGVLVVKEVKTEKLCLGETCVDENTLKNLLQNAGLDWSGGPEPGFGGSASSTSPVEPADHPPAPELEEGGTATGSGGPTSPPADPPPPDA